MLTTLCAIKKPGLSIIVKVSEVTFFQKCVVAKPKFVH